MRQQLEDRGRLPLRRGVGQMSLHAVVDLQLAPLLEQQDRGGGELFGQRTDPGFRRPRVGRVPLEVREAMALAQQHLAATGDEDLAHEPTGRELLLERFSAPCST